MSKENRLLTILTLNLWHDSLPSASREAAQRHLIERLAPDVIAFQEVLRDENSCQAEDLVSALGYQVAYGQVVPFWKRDGVLYGNAIASRYPILNVRNCPLPQGGSSERRAVVFAEVDYSGESIFVASTHLHHRSPKIRSLQIIDVLASYGRFLNDCGGLESSPRFVMGDLNSSPGKECTVALETTFVDAFKEVGVGPGLTWSIDNPYAKLQKSRGARIDYIWGVKLSSAIPKTCTVVGDTGLGGVYPSDHFGVFASYSL